MTEVTIAMSIAWWIGVYHMAIGGYLVFLSERRTVFVVVTGLVKGLLGAGVYLVIRQPHWLSDRAPTVPELLLPATLLVMLLFSVIVTRLIWAAFELDSPLKRAKKLARCAWDWGSRQRCRFKR